MKYPSVKLCRQTRRLCEPDKARPQLPFEVLLFFSLRIRIQAQNSLGTGPFSHTFKLKTKPLPPQPPRLECTAFSHQTLRLKWGDGPPKSVTSDAPQYHLQIGDKSGRLVDQRLDRMAI